MNGFRLEGENFDKRARNAIWAFTPGALTKAGWMSEKSPNADLLVQKGGNFDYALKHSGKFRMTLAVPGWVKNIDTGKAFLSKGFIFIFTTAQILL